MAKAETTETPLLRVSRPVAACSRCRSAKIKCDGKLPACTACERSKKADSCSGANDEFAKGKERSYVASLEARSERLERRLTELKRREGRKISVVMTDSSAQPLTYAHDSGVPQALPLAGLPKGGNKKETSDIDDLVGDFGFLSLNATSRDFHGFTSTMSFARLLLSASYVTELPNMDAKALPPRHTAVLLIQHYLDNIFVLMPFFSETSLFASVEAVYEDSGRGAKSSDHWMLRMVLAISAASQSQQGGDSYHQIALRHVSAALARADSVLHPGSVAGIQAILLLVQYSMFDPERFKVWYLLGMASRVMVDLGIHQDLSAAPNVDKDHLDLRRRVFNGVFSLDRYISMALERAFSFTNDSAEVAPPSTPKRPLTSNLPWKGQLFLRSLVPALHLYEVRHIQSTFYQDLSQSGRNPWPDASPYTFDVCQRLSKWKDQLPTSTPQPIMTLFQLEFLYAYITVLSPSCKVPMVNPANWLLIFESCIDYVNLMRPTIDDPKSHAFFNYFELVRVKVLGQRLIEALRMNYDDILNGQMPQFPPGSSETPMLPFLESRDRRDNGNRAIDCINKIIEILECGRRRWNQGHLRDDFEQKSAVMLARLSARGADFQLYPTGTFSGSIPVNMRGRLSQGNVGLGGFVPEDVIDPTNPRRTRPGYSGYSSF